MERCSLLKKLCNVGARSSLLTRNVEMTRRGQSLWWNKRNSVEQFALLRAIGPNIRFHSTTKQNGTEPVVTSGDDMSPLSASNNSENVQARGKLDAAFVRSVELQEKNVNSSGNGGNEKASGESKEYINGNGGKVQEKKVGSSGNVANEKARSETKDYSNGNGGSDRREKHTNGGERNDGNTGSARWRDRNRLFELMVLAMASGGVTALYFIYDRHMAPTARDLCVDAIASSTCGLDNEQRSVFVQRLQYKECIDKFLERNVRLQPGYMVVAGPRGCGKSTLVLDALEGRKGVIVERFGSESETRAMFSTLLRSVQASYDGISTERDVQRLFLDVQRKHFADHPTWRPTIVTEIDRGMKDDVIVEVSKAMKRLGADLGAAHVILVLSDANASFALPDDPTRQEFLWVEDLNEREAHALFDHYNFVKRRTHGNGSMVEGDANAALRSRIFDNIGTRASELIQAMTKAKTIGASGNDYDAKKVDEYIETRLAQASATVEHLITVRSPLREASGAAFLRLLKEILKNGDNGVSVRDADQYLVAPNRAARIFNEYHAIQYHYPTRSYRFYSVAHQRAVEQLEKEGYFR